VAAHAFDYSDYHRTIIGFHGTDEPTADRLVVGEPLRESDSDDDWFGKGVYFWEYAPKQAWWWARRFKKHDRPAVIGAMIRLGNCFDLLDPANVKIRLFLEAAARGRGEGDSCGACVYKSQAQCNPLTSCRISSCAVASPARVAQANLPTVRNEPPR
jgi:hypothetical protein